MKPFWEIAKAAGERLRDPAVLQQEVQQKIDMYRQIKKSWKKTKENDQ